MEVFSLLARLALDKTGFDRGLDQAEAKGQSFGSRVGGWLGSVGTFAINATAALGAAGVAAGGFAVKLSADFEQTEVAFTTLLGSAETAQTVLANLNQFAASTPFQFPELADATRSLAAFGIEADDLIPTLTNIGDVASGVGAPIGEIADLYGKAKVQGRLFMEDINQLTGRGIPIIGELAAQFGVAESEVRGLVESGQITFDNLEQAFVSLTSEGGRFNDMMAAQSQTLNGLWSTFTDNLTQMLRGIGDRLIETFDLKDKLQLAIDAMSTYSPMIEAAITNTFNAIGTVINSITQAITTFITFFKGQLTTSEGDISQWSTNASSFLSGFLEASKAVFDGLVGLWVNVLMPAWAEIQPFVESLVSASIANWGQAKDNLASVFDFLVALWQQVLYPAWNAISPFVKGVWDAVLIILQTAWSLIEPIFNTITALLKGDFSAAWESAKEAARIALDGLLQAVLTIGEGLVTAMTDIGKNVVSGLIAGIDSMWESAKTKVTDLGSSVAGWFKDVLGIQSPSTVFAEFGGFILEGLINGITGMLASVKDTVTSTANSVLGWFKDVFDINSPSKEMEDVGINVLRGLGQGLENKGLFAELKNKVIAIGKMIIGSLGITIPGVASGTGTGDTGTTPPTQTDEEKAREAGMNAFKNQIMQLAEQLLPGLGQAITAFQAGPVAGISSIFMTLLGRSEAFQALIYQVNKFLEPVIEMFGDLLDALWPVIQVVFELVNGALLPLTFIVRDILGPVLKGVAFIVASIWNGIATALNFLLGWIPGFHIGTVNPNGEGIPREPKDKNDSPTTDTEPKVDVNPFGDPSAGFKGGSGSIAEAVVGIPADVMANLLSPILNAELMQVDLLSKIVGDTNLLKASDNMLKASMMDTQNQNLLANTVDFLTQEMRDLRSIINGNKDFSSTRALGSI